MPTTCPRFDHCGAPLYPLDDWKRRYHVKGEPVCFYLREAAKRGGCLAPRGDIPKELAEKVAEAYREIIFSPCSSLSDVRRRLLRAALSPSKSDTGVSPRTRASP